jgi:hypothetical protein
VESIDFKRNVGKLLASSGAGQLLKFSVADKWLRDETALTHRRLEVYKNLWTEPERLNVAPGLRLLVAGEMNKPRSAHSSPEKTK